MERIPISIWGSPYRNGSPFPNGDRSVTNPFPNRVHAHLGIEVKITIWECFPYGDHRFHLVITIRKWAGRLEYSHMGNPRFRIEFVSIWGSTYIRIRQLLVRCTCWSPNWNEPRIAMGTPQFGILTNPYPNRFGDPRFGMGIT
jgi:hypothetical protein